MNCLDFRRAAQAQPHLLDAAAREHADACPSCRAVLDRELRLDDRIHAALAVPAPDGLADRVMIGQGLRRRPTPARWAIAATVVLTAGIAWLAPPEIAGRGLAREAIAHVVEEPQSLRVRQPVASQELGAALASQGLRLAGELGQVIYWQLCPMAEGQARHVVVATAHGPVTLLLLPDDGGRMRRATAAGEGLAAIAMPAPRGSLAVVAASEQQALAVARLIVPA